MLVHGDIRHLEIQTAIINEQHIVHGDIRHLERKVVFLMGEDMGSWRHTPFRKMSPTRKIGTRRSWRHTPFRKLENPLFV